MVTIEQVIKTIFFDLGGVIVPFDFKRAYARMGPLCGYPATDIPLRLRSTDLVRRFEMGLVEPEPFVEELSRILDIKITHDEFCDLWNCIFLPDALVPEALLAGLRARYRLMLLSNTNPIHFRIVKANYPHLRHFEHCVLSYEVGAMKPSARIYEEAIARAGCSAQECFFTDDLAVNIEAARAHGMDAVQFQSAVQLEGELRARGIEF